MTSQEYWTKRARANKLKTIALEENGIKELKKLLKLNIDDVQSKIQAFYDKYGEDVTANLSAVEMERYKRALRKNVKKYPKDKILRKTLKEDAPKYRIDRLRQLETQLQTQIAATTATQEKVIGATLQDVAAMSNSLVYKAMQDQLQLQFAMIQSERLNVIVNSTWVGDGMTWSERIWGNREKFGEKLTEILSKNNVQGVSLQKTARELQHATGVNFNDCFRVVRTESAHIDNQVRLENALQAQKDIGERLKFRFDAFIDDRTSKICQDMNGKEFYLDDAVEGENLPPLHPNCRSTFVTFSSGEDIEEEPPKEEEPQEIVEPEKFTDAKSANKFFYDDKDYKQWIENLSEKEQEAIGYYTDTTYDEINSFLRKNNGYENIDAKWANEQIGLIDNAIGGFDLKKPIQVIRGVDFKAFNVEDGSNLLKLANTEHVEKSFLSTSVIKGGSKIEKPIEMIINVPTGKGRGAYINQLSMFEDVENEFLLARNSKFKLTNIKEQYGRYVVEADLLVP